MKNKIPLMASSYKKTKQNLSDTYSENKDEDINRFLTFIVFESQDNSSLANMSLFVIEKVISANLKPKMVKKLKNGNLLVEVERKSM